MSDPKTPAPRALRDFLNRCDRLRYATGRTRAAVSFSIFNDGSRLDEIHAGGDIGVRKLDAAVKRLAKLEAAAKVR